MLKQDMIARKLLHKGKRPFSTRSQKKTTNKISKTLAFWFISRLPAKKIIKRILNQMLIKFFLTKYFTTKSQSGV